MEKLRPREFKSLAQVTWLESVHLGYDLSIALYHHPQMSTGSAPALGAQSSQFGGFVSVFTC